MTIAELKALSFQDRQTKETEQAELWKQVFRLDGRRESSRTAEEKTAVLTEFNTLIDNADLIVP